MDPWLFRRISVRYLAAGQASDVIGRVIHRTDEEVHLMRRDGQIEIVPVDDIIAAREVPDTERRLRSPIETSVEVLDAMITRVSGLEPKATGSAARVFVADLREFTIPAEPATGVEVSQQSATPEGPVADLSASELHPELRVFLRTDGADTARAVLCGDWFTLDHLRFAPSGTGTDPQRNLAALFHEATRWAQHRGAFFAWVLVEAEPEHDDLAAALIALGFTEHHRR